LPILAKGDAMGTMNISLPDEMKAWVDEQVRAEGFASSSEYIRAIIRQRKNSVESLRRQISEGVASGDYRDADEAYFTELRDRIGSGTAAE
jgi:antitoxin ParD1/3/4